MKKVFNFLFLTTLFVVSFVAFFPKEKIYSLLQNELMPYSVALESQKVDSNPFSLDLKNTAVLLSGSQVAKIRKAHISLVGMSFEGISAVGSFREYVPVINSIDIKYKTGEFLDVISDAGTARGIVDISAKKLIFEVKLKPTEIQKYAKALTQFKKVGDKYVYELNF